MLVSFAYKNSDSTQHLNMAAKDILPKGVYIYPKPASSWIVPGPGPSLQVIINPGWVCRSTDGMTIREDTATNTIVFPVADNYYVGLHAEYLVARNPILELQAVKIAEYNTWTTAQKKTFIRFCQVNITGNPITQAMIFFDVMELPRGVFALQVDLDLVASSSVVRIINNTSIFPTDPQDNEIFYVEAENAFYIYHLGVFTRVDNPLVGSTEFITTGTTITLPDIAVNKSYFVLVTPTSPTNTHLGDFWVVKAADRFTVYHSGNAQTSEEGHPGRITFDWLVCI